MGASGYQQWHPRSTLANCIGFIDIIVHSPVNSALYSVLLMCTLQMSSNAVFTRLYNKRVRMFISYG